MATATQVQFNPITAAMAHFGAARAPKPFLAKSAAAKLDEAIADYRAAYRDAYEWHQAASDDCDREINALVALGAKVADLVDQIHAGDVASLRTSCEIITDELASNLHSSGLFRQAAAVAARAADDEIDRFLAAKKVAPQ